MHVVNNVDTGATFFMAVILTIFLLIATLPLCLCVCQAEKLKEEKSRHSASSSLLNRQMFPLSCLVPSSSSSSSSSTPFRHSLQDQLDIKSGPDVPQLAAHSLAQRLSSLATYSPVMNGSSYHGLNPQAGAGVADNPGYHVMAQQAGQLGVDSSSYHGLNQQGLMGVDSSSYQGLNNPGLGGAGMMPEPKMGYAWQHLKADCMQPKLNHIHKAVPALLEAHHAQQQQQQQGLPMGETHPGIGIDHGLELLHGRLQRDPRGSRSDPQMDHLRREREYRLGRQTSSEQEIQARLNELPMIVRQERYRRRLERQSSSEQEQASGKPSDQESATSDKRQDRYGLANSTVTHLHFHFVWCSTTTYRQSDWLVSSIMDKGLC